MNFERRIGDRNILDKFTEDFCAIVDRHCKYIVVSGFVAIASGRSRATEDIDMILQKISKDKFIELHNDLEKNGFECMQSSLAEDVFDYLNMGDNVRYTRTENKFFPPEMDIHFAKDEIDEIQLEERQKIAFIGLDVWFSSIESNIAFKEELLKSDKDIEDARHLRKTFEGKFSEEKILNIKERIKKERMQHEG
ncbi:MAG: hypothetical protein AABX11_06165 [Nanoarchaeota archaeon]